MNQLRKGMYTAMLLTIISVGMSCWVGYNSLSIEPKYFAASMASKGVFAFLAPLNAILIAQWVSLYTTYRRLLKMFDEDRSKFEN